MLDCTKYFVIISGYNHWLRVEQKLDQSEQVQRRWIPWNLWWKELMWELTQNNQTYGKALSDQFQYNQPLVITMLPVAILATTCNSISDTQPCYLTVVRSHRVMWAWHSVLPTLSLPLWLVPINLLTWTNSFETFDVSHPQLPVFDNFCSLSVSYDWLIAPKRNGNRCI